MINLLNIQEDIDMMIYVIEVSIKAFVPVVLSIICYTEKHFIFLLIDYLPLFTIYYRLSPFIKIYMYN